MSKIYEEKIKEKKEDGLTIFKSLDANGDFIEAKNILKYKLSINVDIENNIMLSNIVDQLYHQVDFLCSNYLYKIKKYSKRGYKDPIWEFNESILRLSIKNHCIISALYTVKYLYLKGQNISIKELGQFSANCGYWTLKEAIDCLNEKSKRELPLQYSSEELKNILAKMWKPIKYKERSNYTNKFIKLVESKDYEYIINSLSTNNFNKIPVSDSDFTYSLMNYTKIPEKNDVFVTKENQYLNIENILKCIFQQEHILQGMPFKVDKYLKETKDSKQDIYNNFYKKLNKYVVDTLCEYNSHRAFMCDEGYDVIDDFSRNEGHSNAIKCIKVQTDNADRVLFNYKFERAFNKNLIDCIMKEYKYLTDKNSSLIGNSLNKIFSNCVLLPNCFSRTYFIKSILKNDNLSEFNEQHNKLLDSEYGYFNYNNAIRFNEENLNSDIEKANEQIKSFFNFIIHMSYITIPIYERAFFIMLYNYFNKRCSEISRENKDTKNTNSIYNKEALSQMLDTLHGYVNENAEYLMYDFDFDYDYDESIYDKIYMFDKSKGATNTFLLPGEAFFRSKNKNKYIDKLIKNSINVWDTQPSIEFNTEILLELISKIFTRTDVYNSNLIKFSGDIFINDHKKMADTYICNVITNASKMISKI